MVFKYGSAEIDCDRCTETSGRYTLWKDDTPIRTLANVPPQLEIITEGGEIEHAPTPLEAAQERLAEWQSNYLELLADDEARQARLERIEGLIRNLGDSLTLTKLIQFVKDLKSIITEAGNGEDQL